MPSTTPAGWRSPIARLPGTSEGMTSPLICVVSAAASCSMPAARWALKPAHMADEPVSPAMAAMKASVLASRARAALESSARRSLGPMADQAGKALPAASTAAMASSMVAAGAIVATLPSSGFFRSNVAPLPACFFWPLISIEMVVMAISWCCYEDGGLMLTRAFPGCTSLESGISRAISNFSGSGWCGAH